MGTKILTLKVVDNFRILFDSSGSVLAVFDSLEDLQIFLEKLAKEFVEIA